MLTAVPEKNAPHFYKQMRYMMGCLVSVELQASSEAAGQELIQTAFTEMKRVEKLLSRFDPQSIVSEINQHASDTVIKLPSEVYDLIFNCVQMSQLSGGCFDITSAPLTLLWAAAEENGAVPGSHEIKETLAKVGYRHLDLNSHFKTLKFERPHMQIDLGAVGKGYAVDRAAEVLLSRGVDQAVISTGSSIRHIGKAPARFAIQHPFETEKMLSCIELFNYSISTSANSERFFKIGHKCYGHLISPLTGSPVQSRLVSVSVIADTALQSELYSTALFVGGRKCFGRLAGCSGARKAVIAGQRILSKSLYIKHLSL